MFSALQQHKKYLDFHCPQLKRVFLSPETFCLGAVQSPELRQTIHFLAQIKRELNWRKCLPSIKYFSNHHRSLLLNNESCELKQSNLNENCLLFEGIKVRCILFTDQLFVTDKA